MDHEGPTKEPDSPHALSRREFAKRAGAGSAAAAGLIWAAPKISTIKYVSKAAAGSRPPTTGSTVQPTVPVGPLGSRISVSASSPCVGDSIRVIASGFATGAAVTVQLDSAALPIGVTTADGTGAINLLVLIPKTAPTGAHHLRAVGIDGGGTTITLTAPITIKSEAECQAAKTTDSPVDEAGNPVAGDPVAAASTTPAAGAGSGGGSLPLTGTGAVDLAVIGGAAAIGGRVLYGMGKRDPGLDEPKK